MKSDSRYEPLLTSWCAALEVDLDELRGRARTSQHLNQARHVIAYMLRQQCPQPSTPEVGRILHRCDHTMAHKSERKVAAALAAREPWAVLAVAACTAAPRSTLELETPLETLRRCQATQIQVGAIELAEVGT